MHVFAWGVEKQRRRAQKSQSLWVVKIGAKQATHATPMRSLHIANSIFSNLIIPKNPLFLTTKRRCVHSETRHSHGHGLSLFSCPWSSPPSFSVLRFPPVPHKRCMIKLRNLHFHFRIPCLITNPVGDRIYSSLVLQWSQLWRRRWSIRSSIGSNRSPEISSSFRVAPCSSPIWVSSLLRSAEFDLLLLAVLLSLHTEVWILWIEVQFWLWSCDS